MILACALLATAATAQTGPPVPPGACNVWQVCQNHSTLTQGTAPDTACQDAHEVTIPVFVGYVDDTTGEFVASGYEPSKMNSLGTSNLATACPFYDADELLCCNSDTASIMGKYLFFLEALTWPLDRPSETDLLFMSVLSPELPAVGWRVRDGLPGLRRQPEAHVVRVCLQPGQRRIP